MSFVYLSETAPRYLAEYFQRRGHVVRVLPPSPDIAGVVASHPDMLMCKLGVGAASPLVRAAPGDCGREYPKNIVCNAVCLDRYIIHNFRHTLPALLRTADALGLRRIPVRQGYAKCSTVLADGGAVITADEGIARALPKDVELLRVRPGYVALKGFEYGFLGGASGRVGDELVFCGDLSEHPDFAAIQDFAAHRGVELRYFPGEPLTDVGSIIESVF